MTTFYAEMMHWRGNDFKVCRFIRWVTVKLKASKKLPHQNFFTNSPSERWNGYHSVRVVCVKLRAMIPRNASDSSYDFYLSVIDDPNYWLTLTVVGYNFSTVIILTNAFLLFTIYQDPRKSLRSPSSLLIANLTASDLLMGLGVLLVAVRDTYRYEQLHMPYVGIIKVVIYIIYFTSVFVSGYTIIAMSIACYIAIKKPLEYKIIITVKRVKIFIVGVWVIALATCSHSRLSTCRVTNVDLRERFSCSRETIARPSTQWKRLNREEQTRVRGTAQNDFDHHYNSGIIFHDLHASVHRCTSAPLILQVLSKIDKFLQSWCGSLEVFVSKLGDESVCLRLEGFKVPLCSLWMFEDYPKETQTFFSNERWSNSLWWTNKARNILWKPWELGPEIWQSKGSRPNQCLTSIS